VNEVVTARYGDRFGKSMNGFFDQTLLGTDVCDYEATSVSSERIRTPQGVVDSTRLKSRPARGAEKPAYESRVLVSRLGEIVLPVDVRVRFDDGSTLTELWNGRERTKEYRYEGPARAVALEVDPDGKLPLDIKPMNNTYVVETPVAAGWKAAVSVMHWLQNILMSASLF